MNIRRLFAYNNEELMDKLLKLKEKKINTAYLTLLVITIAVGERTSLRSSFFFFFENYVNSLQDDNDF